MQPKYALHTAGAVAALAAIGHAHLEDVAAVINAEAELIEAYATNEVLAVRGLAGGSASRASSASSTPGTTPRWSPTAPGSAPSRRGWSFASPTSS